MLYKNALSPKHQPQNRLPPHPLKNQIPKDKPCTQPNRPPKHRLRRTPPLRRTLELCIPTTNIRLRGIHVADELGDVFFLCGKVRDEGLLEGRDFQ